MDWPLPLWRVLREELKELRPNAAKPTTAIEAGDEFVFVPDDISDSYLLTGQILKRWPELKAALPADILASWIKEGAVAFLNKLLKQKDLYKAFPTVPESWYVQKQNPSGLNDGERAELNRALLDRAFAGGVRPVGDKVLLKVVDELRGAKLSALCFSGGGIRSATFCLGVLQALARNPLSNGQYALDKFDYLSTVSGGGFVGGWLSAWTYWSPRGLTEVMERLRDPRPSKLEPEPDPIFYLRNFSNYLSPRTGLLSADTWTLFATYMRNLLLNWSVLLPLLIALLVVPRLMLVLLDPAVARNGVGTHLPDHAGLAWLALAVLGFACAMFYQGVARPSHVESLKRRANSWRWSRWWLNHRAQSDFLKFCLGPLVLSAFIFSTFAYYSYLFKSSGLIELGIFLAFGALSAAIGWIAYALTVWVWYFWDFLAVLFSAAAGMALFFLILNGWSWLDLNLKGCRELYLCLATPLVLIVFLIAATIFVGLATLWTNDEDREYWARMGAWFLAASGAWIAFGAISLFGPRLFELPGWDKGWSYLGSAIVSFVTAYLGFSDKTPASIDQEPVAPSSSAIQRVLPSLGAISIVLILAVLAMLSGLLVDAMTGLAVAAFPSEQNNIWLSLVGALLAIAIAWRLGRITSALIDPNKYSLHSMYRNRLIRAYLGASRENGTRHADPFTGFDPEDNLAMDWLWKKKPRKLMPFINIALNMVEPVSTKLSWQERKAESFTITPLHAGSFWVGYRKSSEYAKWNSWRQDGTTPITLGTATAISGAAVSPNMGYNSSPIVSMLLTLFNARLGWWLGNPGMAGNDTFRYSNPGKGGKYMIDEALGRTNDEKPYVYLSDGGHFENLGLYEMVLRRCQTIVVIDADEDQGYIYENLGNAIRKIRTDLGIPIEFPNFSNFRKYNEGGPTLYCSIGQIRYSVEDPGKENGSILYVKPTIKGDETGDVLNYERQHRDFPHESTANQWFSESQFESYRALGEQEMAKILKEPATSGNTYAAAKKILQDL